MITKLLQGDCLKLMQDIPVSLSIVSLITSIPINI